ncbi:putative ribosomal protein S17e [Helianthus anomalus]
MTVIKTDLIEVDKETTNMLVALGMGDLPGVVKATVEPQALRSVPCGFGRGGGFARKY